jgi:hypothetical protein
MEAVRTSEISAYLYETTQCLFQKFVATLNLCSSFRTTEVFCFMNGLYTRVAGRIEKVNLRKIKITSNFR